MLSARSLLEWIHRLTLTAHPVLFAGDAFDLLVAQSSLKLGFEALDLGPQFLVFTHQSVGFPVELPPAIQTLTVKKGDPESQGNHRQDQEAPFEP